MRTAYHASSEFRVWGLHQENRYVRPTSTCVVIDENMQPRVAELEPGSVMDYGALVKVHTHRVYALGYEKPRMT